MKSCQRTIDGVSQETIDLIYKSDAGIKREEMGEGIWINEYLTLRNGSSSVLAVCHADGMVRKVWSRAAFGIAPRNMEQHFAIDALLNETIPLVVLTGKAGTGKTLFALAAGLEYRSKFRQILLSRPIIPLGNDVGYLPGDLKDKLGPYMQPLHDNLSVIKHTGKEATDKIAKMLEEEKIVIEPLTYIRGRSLVRSFFIIDEAQNLTPHEVKTIVTRAGEGTKVVFTGDVEQIDKPSLTAESNGLAHMIRRLSGHRLFAHVNLEKGERSELAEMAGQLL